MSDVYRGSNVASAILSTACKLSLNTTGGTETSVTSTAPIDSSTTKYIEILAQTGSPADNASLPAQDGKGWFYDTGLAGKTIPAGNWSAACGEADGSGTTTIEYTIRFSKYNTGTTTYTTIGTIVVSVSTATTRTSVSFSATSESAVVFGTNETLYVDLFARSTTSGWLGDTMKNFVSTSGTAGVAGDLEITAPTAVTTGGATHLRISDGYGGCFS